MKLPWPLRQGRSRVGDDGRSVTVHIHIDGGTAAPVVADAVRRVLIRDSRRPWARWS